MTTPAHQPRFGERERRIMLRVARRILGDKHAAEDATQDALLLAYRHRASFRGDSHFTTWLYRIAATTALMHLRRARLRGAQVAPPSLADVVSLAAPGLSPEDQVIVEDELARAGRRLAELGRLSAAIVKMSFGEGYTSREIGRQLGLNEGTVKSRAHRGRAALRAAAVEARAGEPAGG